MSRSKWIGSRRTFRDFRLQLDRMDRRGMTRFFVAEIRLEARKRFTHISSTFLPFSLSWQDSWDSSCIRVIGPPRIWQSLQAEEASGRDLKCPSGCLQEARPTGERQTKLLRQKSQRNKPRLLIGLFTLNVVLQNQRAFIMTCKGLPQDVQQSN